MSKPIIGFNGDPDRGSFMDDPMDFKVGGADKLEFAEDVKLIPSELKARLSLLDADFLMEMAKVGDFGTRKYAEEDWRDNDKVSVKGRMDSLLRHANKFNSSSESDLESETHLSHLAHAAYNCMMIWWIAKNRPQRDNRYKGSK